VPLTVGAKWEHKINLANRTVAPALAARQRRLAAGLDRCRIRRPYGQQFVGTPSRAALLDRCHLSQLLCNRQGSLGRMPNLAQSGCRAGRRPRRRRLLPTPTLPGRYSDMITELHFICQRERRSAPRGSAPRPGHDRLIWHGSGMPAGLLIALVSRNVATTANRTGSIATRINPARPDQAPLHSSVTTGLRHDVIDQPNRFQSAYTRQAHHLTGLSCEASVEMYPGIRQLQQHGSRHRPAAAPVVAAGRVDPTSRCRRSGDPRRACPAPGNTARPPRRRERDRVNKPALVQSRTTVGRTK